jgi:hypothetical protein
MARRRNSKNGKNPLGINLRLLKKEIKMIPFDIRKEMRLLDLLFNEKGYSRTQVEKEVLLELIEKARNVIKMHHDKLDRYQKMYEEIRTGRNAHAGLLTPEEIDVLRKRQAPRSSEKKKPDEAPKVHLRTGTNG